MTGRRIVTENMAECMQKDLAYLSYFGIKTREALEIIQDNLEEDFGKRVSIRTIRGYATEGFDGYNNYVNSMNKKCREKGIQRESQEKYRRSEKFREARKEHIERTRKPRNPNYPTVFHVFNGSDDKLNSLMIWNESGGSLRAVRRKLRKAYIKGFLTREKIGNTCFYTPCFDSSTNLAEDKWEEKIMELDGILKQNNSF